MKLRIRGNSLRLRLGRGEVARVGDGHRVEETVDFGTGPESRLVYSVESSATAGAIGATFAGSEVKVTLPAALARDWAEGDAVGLEAAQPARGGTTLKILVEKDFACLAPRSDEDESDAYDNPSTTC